MKKLLFLIFLPSVCFADGSRLGSTRSDTIIRLATETASGGVSVYPATATARFPEGLTAGSVIVDPITGNIDLQSITLGNGTDVTFYGPFSGDTAVYVLPTNFSDGQYLSVGDVFGTGYMQWVDPPAGGGVSVYPATGTVITSSISISNLLTLGNVVRISTTGVWNIYRSTGNDDAARGQALYRASLALENGEAILVGPATYYMTSTIRMKEGSSISGIGKPLIYDLVLTEPIVTVASNNVTVSGIRFRPTTTGIGLHSAVTSTATGVVIRDVEITPGDTVVNGIMWSQSSGGGNVPHFIRADIHDSILTGGSNGVGSGGYGAYSRLTADGRIRMYNCDVFGDTDGILFNGDGDSEIYGGYFRSTLDAMTSGNDHSMTIVGSKARGDQADIYSDDGPITVKWADFRMDLLVGNNIQYTTSSVAGFIEVQDHAYSATGWNGSLAVPTKNAIRDKIESLSGGGASISPTTTTIIAAKGIQSTTATINGVLYVITDGGGSGGSMYFSPDSPYLILNAESAGFPSGGFSIQTLGSEQAYFAAAGGSNFIIGVATTGTNGGAGLGSTPRIVINNSQASNANIYFNPLNRGFTLWESSASFDSPGNDPFLDWQQEGRLNVSNGDFTVNGSSVCRADGTNCPVEFCFAVTDEITAITTGNKKVIVRPSYAISVSSVIATVSTASTSGVITVDVNENSVSIFSTLMTIDANEFSNFTAATGAVVSDSNISKLSELSVDVDGAGTDATGLKVCILGTRL